MTISSATDPAAEASRPIVQSMRRGSAGKCPACGSGKLFARYLKVADR